jgi:hypothetical protein
VGGFAIITTRKKLRHAIFWSGAAAYFAYAGGLAHTAQKGQ